MLSNSDALSLLRASASFSSPSRMSVSFSASAVRSIELGAEVGVDKPAEDLAGLHPVAGFDQDLLDHARRRRAEQRGPLELEDAVAQHDRPARHRPADVRLLVADAARGIGQHDQARIRR